MERCAATPYLACLMFVALAMLAGCSGSSGASNVTQGTVDREPVQPQPADDTADPDPAAEASVSLSASSTAVASGDAVTLTWSSDNADACSASGGWSGVRETEGSLAVGPLTESTTFTLTCSGDGGNAMAMLSVSVLGVVSLAWQAPTENVDGTPLTDLAGYRIFYGEQSRSYTEELALTDAAATDHSLTLPSGYYYFALTAVDAAGNQSAFSNEVVKVVD